MSEKLHYTSPFFEHNLYLPPFLIYDNILHHLSQNQIKFFITFSSNTSVLVLSVRLQWLQEAKSHSSPLEKKTFITPKLKSMKDSVPVPTFHPIKLFIFNSLQKLKKTKKKLIFSKIQSTWIQQIKLTTTTLLTTIILVQNVINNNLNNNVTKSNYYS